MKLNGLMPGCAMRTKGSLNKATGVYQKYMRIATLNIRRSYQRCRLSNNAGFTLIECLVALFIIAIVLASSTRAIGLSIEDVREVYLRQVANWAVENQANQYLLDKVYPEMGQTKKNVTLGGITLIVQSVVVATPNPFFRKIEISVTEARRPNHTLFKTVNFISQY